MSQAVPHLNHMVTPASNLLGSPVIIEIVIHAAQRRRSASVKNAPKSRPRVVLPRSKLRKAARVFGVRSLARESFEKKAGLGPRV